VLVFGHLGNRGSGEYLVFVIADLDLGDSGNRHKALADHPTQEFACLLGRLGLNDIPLMGDAVLHEIGVHQ
jgi:hypothetical protein